jgi:hypothetical protein
MWFSLRRDSPSGTYFVGAHEESTEIKTIRVTGYHKEHAFLYNEFFFKICIKLFSKYINNNSRNFAACRQSVKNIRLIHDKQEQSKIHNIASEEESQG